MGAVDQGVHPAGRELRHQLVDGQDEGRGRGDVVEHRQAGARRDRRQYPLDDVLGTDDRERAAARSPPGRRSRWPRRPGRCGRRCTRGRWSAARRRRRAGASGGRRSRRSSRCPRRQGRPDRRRRTRRARPVPRRGGPPRSREKKATGSRSIRCRIAAWASRTAVGVAPNEPWFMNSTAGSSAQRARNSDGMRRLS